MRRVAVLIAAGCFALFAAGAASPSTAFLPGFGPTTYSSGGGTVFAGSIPGTYAPVDPAGSSYVYLPPRFTTSRRYPVVYLLHGMPGTPRIYVGAPTHLARVASKLVAAGARPFIVVVPYAGPATNRGRAEWAGRWEDYLVHDVVPWTDAHLPTIRASAGRVIAGLSAGGYGALDIGLRHLDMFGTLESWSGYFKPILDGPFVHAPATDLAAHDPSLLVRKEASSLSRNHTRIELSTGIGHGPITPALTAAFAAELHRLKLTCEFWRVPTSVRVPDYPGQLKHGLAYAFAPARSQ